MASGAALADNLRRCSCCREIKPTTEFYARRDGAPDRYRHDCKGCTKIRSARYRQDHPDYSARSLQNWRTIPPEKKKAYALAYYQRQSRDLISWVRLTMPTKRSSARKRGLAFELTPGDVIAVYIRQKGRCALTGRELRWGGGTGNIDPNALSIDRIDNDAGYYLWNIRLVTYQVNWARSKFSDLELYKLCRDVIKTFSEDTEYGPRQEAGRRT